MSDFALTLAQHPRFPRETPGILWIDPTDERDPIRIIERGVLIRHADAAPIYRPGARNPVPFPTGRVPDLSDPATAGVLLAMLDETERLTAVSPAQVGDGWYVELDGDPIGGGQYGETLGHAVAQALLLAWGPS